MNSAHAGRFARAAARATEAGTLLAAARETDGQLCYPGCLSPLYSASASIGIVRPTVTVAVTTAGTRRSTLGLSGSVPGVPPSRNLHGISFGVANMTGFIVRACEAESGGVAGTGGVDNPSVGAGVRM